MAGANLLTLLDDITSLLDDVAVLTQAAGRKTAGVLGDDLALNAQQVSGIAADRELPVVWKVFLGSLRNKLILVPAALVISALAPWAINPLLMVGGLFLCYEGFEKVAHRFWPHGAEHARAQGAAHDAAQGAAHATAPAAAQLDAQADETQRIQGAVRTDFILSAEIIAISLGTVASQTFGIQAAVLSAVALIMTLGVYGLVACIVKLDDAGLALTRTRQRLLQGLGRAILAAAPWLMRFLSIAGTAAMFLVGGGILTHGVGALHHLIEDASAAATLWPGVGAVAGALVPSLINFAAGILAGAVVLGVVGVVARLRGKTGAH